MLTEVERRDFSPIDPYMRQSIVEDITTIDTDETENEVQIHDYAQFDYEKFRDKTQIIPQSSAIFSESRYQDDDHEQERDSKMSDEEVKERFLTPLYVITAVFATMLFLGPLLVRKGPNRGIVQSSIMLSAVCMWIFDLYLQKPLSKRDTGPLSTTALHRLKCWFTIYFGQMNPLMGPRLENTTVAWIAYKLGKHVGGHSA